MTGQKDTIHNNFLSNYPVEIVSIFCADSAHWRFYNKKKKKKIEKKKNFFFFFFFFEISGAKADPRYKRIRVITRRVLTGLTCNFMHFESIAPDKVGYCIFTQLLEPENAIKFISMRTKTQ